jgi:hypothetical protein
VWRDVLGILFVGVVGKSGSLPVAVLDVPEAVDTSS